MRNEAEDKPVTEGLAQAKRYDVVRRIGADAPEKLQGVDCVQTFILDPFRKNLQSFVRVYERLRAEINEALNELFGADTTDADMLHYTRGIADRR